MNKLRLALALMVVIVPACGKRARTKENPVERGKYLVILSGCNDCHTPKITGPNGAPMPDTKKLLSGHPENDHHRPGLPMI
jgi:hypothetical protein